MLSVVVYKSMEHYAVSTKKHKWYHAWLDTYDESRLRQGESYWLDKKLNQEQVWHVLSLEFNSDMKFVKEEDIKNGKQLKDFLGTVEGQITLHALLMYTLLSHYNHLSFCRHCEEELFSLYRFFVLEDSSTNCWTDFQDVER